MTITYSDSKKVEFEKFKKEGGNITFEIDATDISQNKKFEEFPSIKPKLKTGFEIPPTSMIEAPELQALISVYGSPWDYILARVYLSQGKVIYKQIQNGKYEAHCSTPKKS
ncbi:MAG: hypothetical protein COA74_11650 [Gammaproteobacteria bacterium]|nr:MAG: hypothetical protein COA74_11650 [Gammaproteobacteria bacterium]